MNKRHKIQQGSRAVMIIEQDGIFSARLWVNCTSTDLGDATLLHGTFKTWAGVQKWAKKVMA